MNPTLTVQEFNIIIEGVKLWSQECDCNGHGQGELISSMLSGDTEAIVAAKKRIAAIHEASLRKRDERSVMLRAKLIQMRNSIRAEEMIEEAISGEPLDSETPKEPSSFVNPE